MIGPLLLLLTAAGAPSLPDTPAYTVPADWHLIEGIASDGKRVWVSSVVDRAILELDAKRGVRKALRLPSNIGAPFGIAWDAKRRWIWVAAMCPVEPVIADCGRSGVFAVDPSGKVRRSLTVEGSFNPGDISVDTERSRVFASDSLNGAIYACDGDCTALRPVIRPTGRASAQGTALTRDGRALVVADYSRGIILVDLETGAEKAVQTADGKRLRGVDGLTRLVGSYVAVANAGNPAQLVEFQIGEDGSLADATVIDGPSGLGEATQIVNVGDRLLLVGDAQWRHYAGKEAAGPGAQGPTPIFALPLIRGK